MKNILLTSLVCVALAIQSSHAAQIKWICNDGSWDNSACWDPAGQPLVSDDVDLTQTDEVDRTVTYAETESPVPVLNSLTINKASSGTMTLSQSQGSLDATTEYVGYNGTGTYTQTGGENNVSDLYLGYLETGVGTYNLSGTGSLLADNEIISRLGNGTFNQTGGTNKANFIAIANADGSDTSGITGTYNLSGGSLSVDNMDVGSSSSGSNPTGVFNQSGGIVTVNNRLNLADLNGASGTYNLSSGDLDAGELGMWDVDETGITGIVNQTGGTVTTNRVVSTYYDFTYNLDGGSLTTNTIDLQANANFNQTSGVNNVSDTLILDISRSTGDSDSGSRYTLTDGTLNAGNIEVRGSSAFNFNGGRLAVDNFTGNLVNNGGTLAPGNSPGTTQVNGNYTQAVDGTFEVEIGGLQQGSEYDWLNITDAATLAGTLDVGLIDLGSGPFTLGEGDVFDILSAESITGEFDVLTLAALDEGLKWDVSYLTDVSGTTDLVRLTINANVLPTANAGIDQIVNEGDVVNLNGNLSTDSDGAIAGYSWTQTSGTTVVLSGASTATPSFTAPEVTEDTTLMFSLVVTDNDAGSSSADSVSITVSNDNVLPTADAGNDQVVNEGAIVDLDGQTSSDSDGSIDSFNWTQTAGTAVSVSGANTATPSFTAPSVISDTVLVFSLVVTDNNGDTDTASVSITVANVLVVDAGTDQQMTEGDIVQLNGLNSLGVNGSIVNYLWTQTEGPTVILDDSGSATPSFIAPAVDATTLLVFKLTVSDSNGLQDYDTTFVNVRDELSTAIAPPLDIQLLNTVVSGNTPYQFDTMSDPFFASTNVQWSQVNGPAVSLAGADTATPSFTTPTVSVDSATTFEVRSTSFDGLTVRAGVNVNILGPDSVNLAPDANAGIDQVVTEGDTVYLDATDSIDSDGRIVSYYWQQTGGPMALLSSILEAQPSFVAPAIAAVDDGTPLTFEVVVTDNDGFMDRQSVTVTILDNGIVAFDDDVIAIISSSGDPIGIQAITGGSLIALAAIDPVTIVDNVNRPSSLPYGLLDFSLRVEPGASVQVSFVLPLAADAGLTWWKYADGIGWQDYSANTTFNVARDVVTITLTDNGTGDDDPTPGVIHDPGGLALTSAPATGGGQPQVVVEAAAQARCYWCFYCQVLLLELIQGYVIWSNYLSRTSNCQGE